MTSTGTGGRHDRRLAVSPRWRPGGPARVRGAQPGRVLRAAGPAGRAGAVLPRDARPPGAVPVPDPRAAVALEAMAAAGRRVRVAGRARHPVGTPGRGVPRPPGAARPGFLGPGVLPGDRVRGAA